MPSLARWPFLQRNHRYSVGEMLLTLLYPMILGLERLEAAQLLRQNGVFPVSYRVAEPPRCHRAPAVPSGGGPTALPKLRALHRRMVRQPRPPTRVILYVDFTAPVFYGQHEHGELRPGDAHTASGTLDLLATGLAKIPSGVRLRIVRADKGFFDHELVEWLEGRRARFVVVARLTPPIKRKLSHLRYVSPSRGVEVAEFHYQPTRWPRPYRCASW